MPAVLTQGSSEFEFAMRRLAREKGKLSWRIIVLGIAMAASHLLFVITVAEPSARSGGGIAFRLLFGGVLTWQFLRMWNERGNIVERIASLRSDGYERDLGPARVKNPIQNRSAVWPLGAFLLVPALAGVLMLVDWVEGPSPSAVLAETVAANCGTGTYGTPARTGLVEFNDEVIVVGGSRRDSHSDAVSRLLTTRDPGYQEYRDTVLDGRTLRPTRVVCITNGTPGQTPTYCDAHIVRLHTAETQEILGEARVDVSGPCGRLSEGEKFFSLGASSSDVMTDLVNLLYAK